MLFRSDATPDGVRQMDSVARKLRGVRGLSLLQRTVTLIGQDVVCVLAVFLSCRTSEDVEEGLGALSRVGIRAELLSQDDWTAAEQLRHLEWVDGMYEADELTVARLISVAQTMRNSVPRKKGVSNDKELFGGGLERVPDEVLFSG